MYAIIETGSKQYRIKEGDIIDIELTNLSNEKTVEFKNVIFFHDGTKMHVGTPYVENCLITAEFLKEVKGEKVIAYKYKRRKNYKRKKGHRQKYMQVKIMAITAS